MSNNNNTGDIKFESISGIVKENKSKNMINVVYHQNITQFKEESELKRIYTNLDNIVYPEVMRRIKEGKLTSKFRLQKVQLIMYFDYHKNEILLNDDVKINVGVELTVGNEYKNGTVLNEDDIKKLTGIYPSEKNDPNAAHVIMIKFKNRWYESFYLTYNLDLAQKTLDNAQSYINKSSLCIQNKSSEFINNIFSAMELSIKSLFLIRLLHKEFSLEQEINKTIEQFSIYSKNGNIERKYLDTFLKIIEFKNNSIQLESEKEILDTVLLFFNYVKNLVEFYVHDRLPKGKYFYTSL